MAGTSNIQDPDLRQKVDRVFVSLEPALRQQAERDLGELLREGASSIPAMAALLSEATRSVAARLAGCWWLGRLGDSRAIQSLLEALERGEDEAVSFEAAKSLISLDITAAEPVLIRVLLSEGMAPARLAAAYALGYARSKAAPAALRSVLESHIESESLRGQAAESLGLLVATDSFPVLLEGLHDGSPEVRFWSAYALGRLGNREAIPALAKLAASDHAQVAGWWEVSREAADAIESIKSSQGP
ncbi:MAG: HEAT repeat domain-containing protein [Acidobacteriota bacterium]|nr:HEAT repeat domain-containing protein [Acidobacteriota bacterium]